MIVTGDGKCSEQITSEHKNYTETDDKNFYSVYQQ